MGEYIPRRTTKDPSLCGTEHTQSLSLLFRTSYHKSSHVFLKADSTAIGNELYPVSGILCYKADIVIAIGMVLLGGLPAERHMQLLPRLNYGSLINLTFIYRYRYSVRTKKLIRNALLHLESTSVRSGMENPVMNISCT